MNLNELRPTSVVPWAKIAPLLAVILLPFGLWLLLASKYVHSGNRVSLDSAAYIDCARSIRDGRGFKLPAQVGLGLETWKPIRLWPPGYPILVAGAISLGLSPYHSALVTSVVCSGLFVIFVLGFYANRLPFAVALPLGLVFVSMKALLNTGTMCWSEGLYLLLTVVSLLCLLKGATNSRVTNHWLILAGLTGGFSWCVRNIACALFGASIFYLTVQLARFQFREAALASCAWLGGWLFACSWLVLWNISTFGTPTPYQMPPSELSFFANCKTALRVMTYDLTTLGYFADFVINTYVLITLGLGILTLLFVRRHTWRPILCFLRGHREPLLLLLFLGFYTFTIVMARSVYRWGENINSRHFIPIYWIMLLYLGVGVEWISRYFLAKIRIVRRVLIAAIGLLAAIQMKESVMSLTSPSSEKFREIRWTSVALGREIPVDKIVLTDAIAPLRVFGNVNARRLPGRRYGETLLTLGDIQRAGKDGHLRGLVIVHEDEYARGDYGDALRDISTNAHSFPELRERQFGTGTRILQYIGNGEVAR